METLFEKYMRATFGNQWETLVGSSDKAILFQTMFDAGFDAGLWKAGSIDRPIGKPSWLDEEKPDA